MPLTNKQFVLSRGRQLPLHQHFVNKGYDVMGLAHVIISRRHNDGCISYAVFLADLLARGIKDAFFEFHVEPEQFQQLIATRADQLVQVNYELAHNLVWAAHDFGVENNLPQHVDFQWLQQFLEPDEAVELVEIPVGDGDGLPFLMVESSEHYAPLLRRLEAAVGKDGYRMQVTHQGQPVSQAQAPWFAGTHADPEDGTDEDEAFEEAELVESQEPEPAKPLPSEAHHPEEEEKS